MTSLSRPFIHRPKATALLFAGFLVLGLLAFLRLPLESLPDVSFPTINVNANFPGASAETMASAVASPLEKAFANISGVTGMSSSSSLGTTQITIQFDLSRDIDAAAQDVQAAINSAGGELPKDMPNPPYYHKSDPNGYSLLNVAVTSDTLPLPVVQDYIDNVLGPSISRVSGVGVVDYHGEQEPAIRLQIDPETLAARGLDLEDLRSAISLTTLDSPKGQLAGPRQSLLIGANDQMLRAEEYRQQIVAWQNGAPLRVADLGTAVDGPQDRQSAAWWQGRPAIVVDIHKMSGSHVNTTDIVDHIKELLPTLAASMPAGIELHVAADHTLTTRASVHDVEITLAITVGLVAFVIFLFLREVRATVIPSISIPLSLIGTFGCLYLLKFSLDNISLMGLTIAVGFVVDDAIVVMENIMRHREMGKDRITAAIDGSGEVGFTVISMTLSLIAVFLPLLLMGGVIGILFREFSITVAIALILSGIISLTQTAVSCSLLSDTQPRRAGFYRVTERGFNAMLAGYRRGLDWVLRHGRFALAVTLGLLLGSAILFVIVPKGFVPEQDTGVISVTAEAAPDTSYGVMCDKVRALADIAQHDPAVDNVYAFVEGQPASNIGRLNVVLKPFSQRSTPGAKVLARLRGPLNGIPGIKVYGKLQQDIQIGTRSTKTQYQYVLQGSDMRELTRWSKILVRRLQSSPQLLDVASDLNPPTATVTVDVDRDKAASYGITPSAVDQILYDAFGQREVATVFTALNQRKVILEVGKRWRLDLTGLAAIRIRSPRTGDLVPLTAIARLESAPSALTINHLDSYPAVTLSFNLPAGVSLSEAVAAIDLARAELHLPPSIRASFQGAAKSFQDSLASQPLLILGAIAVVYIILGVLYESFLHPITILSSLPSATFGALAAMVIFHYDLSVMTLIGLILLVGIVKKNAIMMVDVALHLQRQGALAAEKAIREACLLRFRPIMMTTMAALLGAIPLAISTGAGSELRRPLGVAVVGGLFVSQIVTLFTVPTIFIYMDRMIQWAAALRAAAAPDATPALNHAPTS